MLGLRLAAKGYALFLISALEIGTPFIRMVVLAHLLDLGELGFASALAATYAMFEQITDIAVYRFVFSAPREHFADALAGAHALSIARGLVVGALAIAAAPLIASGLSLGADWRSFAWLGAVISIRSFEHLGPRVAERDYRYGPQLKVTLASTTVGLTAMLATAFWTADHNALVMSLFGQMIGMVVAGHLTADVPYRVAFRSKWFLKAFRYGYPLMFNGLGLALSSQGDRFLVGALLGLPALGVYAVTLLVTIVPMAMVGRITTAFTLATLYNARSASTAFDARLSLVSRILPLVHAGYALGIIALMNIVVPRLFGQKFEVSHWAIAILASGAFFRMVRGDPFSSLLMHEGRTKRLAIANLSSVSSLIFAVAFMLLWRHVEAAMLGRLFGEVLAYAVTIALTFELLRKTIVAHATSVLFGVSAIGVGWAALFLTPVGTNLSASLVFLAAYFILALAWVWRFIPELLRIGFARGDDGATPSASVEREAV